MSIDFSQEMESPIVTTSFTSSDEGEFTLRPKHLNEYNGQEKVKENLSVYIEAAKRRNEPLDHVLLSDLRDLAKQRLQGSLPTKWASTSELRPALPLKRRETLRGC